MKLVKGGVDWSLMTGGLLSLNAGGCFSRFDCAHILCCDTYITSYPPSTTLYHVLSLSDNFDKTFKFHSSINFMINYILTVHINQGKHMKQSKEI